MAAQAIHHVSITVNDFARSEAFYTKLFASLGAAPVFAATGAPHKHPEGRMVLFAGKGFMFGVWEAFPEHRGSTFDRYRVGLHHSAFAVESRAEIDDLHRQLVADGVPILDAPAEYPYAPGYYAFYFTDPDGMKIEVVHMPAA
jgi:glyoxylase I family protein